MLKAVQRCIRERFERNVIQKKEKVDNAAKKKTCYCICSTSYLPYLSKNQRFSYQPFALKYEGEKKYQDESDKFKTKCLDQTWTETLGLSGILAFGWALSQNMDLKRKRALDQLIDFHQNRRYHRLKRALCPYYTLKNVFPKQILAQPNAVLNVNVLLNSQSGADAKLTLPVYGPLTADEALNEVSEGLRKARNTAAGELENRMGLRCMSKRRYRKAIIHFAAGSALRNSSAAYNLGQCYELGLGTNKDFIKAAKYYRIASNLGNATATFNLAVFYAQGLGGLMCDLKKARELLEKAVDLGDSQAKISLETLVKDKKNLQIGDDVHLIHQNEMKATSEKKSILTTLQLSFSEVTQDDVTKMDSYNAVSSVLRNKEAFYGEDGSKSSMKFADTPLKNEFHEKKNCNEIVEEYTVYSGHHKINPLPTLPFYGEILADISKKEFEASIPFIMKLSKIATVPGH